MPRKDPEARRAYHRAYMRTWYRRNKEIHVRRVRQAFAKRLALLAERINALKDRPCTDCGVRYPSYVMDFDHVHGEKVADICAMRRKTMEWERIVAEIEKCEVVCSNCHRARTHARRQALLT